VKTPPSLPFFKVRQMLDVGKAVRRIRQQKNLRQAELAQEAGITASFLSLIETGKRHPSLALLERLSNELDVPMDVVLWDALELPEHMSHEDRRVCELAKTLVRHYLEGIDAREMAVQGRPSEEAHRNSERAGASTTHHRIVPR